MTGMGGGGWYGAVGVYRRLSSNEVTNDGMAFLFSYELKV